MKRDKKLIRITTISMSLSVLLRYQLQYMNEYYEVVAIADPDGGGLEQVSEREGVRTIAVPMTRAITPFKDLKALFELYRIFKKERPHIVHTHTPKAGLLGMVAAWMAGVPVRLHTVAGLPLLEVTGMKRKVLDEVEKIAYKCAHKVYPNSSELKSIITESKLCRPEKLKVIANGSSNGVDTDYFSPDGISAQQREALKTELEIKDGDVVFCFIGRLVGDKGINELVQAFVETYKSSPHAKLILVGPAEKELDPLEPETEKYINEHPAIKWVGYQSDVRPYLAISHVFAFPSYREGFPNVVMQAGAMGLPCIVSNINGCNEIITDGFNGIIIPVKSTDALQQKIGLLLNDNKLRDKLASESRRLILLRYKREIVWKGILDEYSLMEKQQAL